MRLYRWRRGGRGRRTFGPVVIYVANAGITGQVGLGDDEAAWDQIIAINLRAHIRAAKAVVPEWLERASGHFVAVALGGRPADRGVRRVNADGACDWSAL